MNAPTPMEPVPPTNPSPSAVAIAKPPDNIPTKPQINVITERQLLEDLSRSTKTSFETLTNLVLDFGQRVVALEQRANTSSDRAKSPSEHDLDAQAKIASEVIAREQLAAKVDGIAKVVATVAATTDATATKVDGIDVIKDAIVSWWTTPTGKKVRALLWVAAVAYLERHNIHLP